MNSRVLQIVLSTIFVGIFGPVLAQKNYYVVVGAFSTEGEARELTTHLPVMNADTAYAMNDQGHVVQLYVMRTSSEDLAIEKSEKLQSSLEDLNEGPGLGNYESVSVTRHPEGKSISFRKGIEIEKDAAVSDASASRASSLEGASMGAPAVKPNSTMFKFTITAPDGRPVAGKVHFVDVEKERDLATYASNTYTDIMNPGRYHNDMALVCAVFGYKESEKYLDYNNPSFIEGAYTDENGAWVIPYNLERLAKGDVSVMYNVSFHKDAVVMLPQSMTDLEELLKMMRENPGYEITIHGHCNGKNDRKIIALGSQNDLFDIGESRQIFGSSKKLSSLRAQAVKSYLIQNGVDEKRIRTYAWGGRLMLADPASNYAKLNDRIEIEITND